MKMLVMAGAALVLVFAVGCAVLGQDDPEEGRQDIHPGMEKEESRPPRDMGHNREGGRGGQRYEEMMERMVYGLKQRNPELFDQLMKLRATDQDAFREKLREVMREQMQGRGEGGRKGEMDQETRDRMREISELEKHSRDMGGQYQQAETEEEKGNIAEELKTVLTKIFGLKHLNQQKEIERLQEKLKELEHMLEKRDESKEEIIQQRFDELTGAAEHMEW